MPGKSLASCRGQIGRAWMMAYLELRNLQKEFGQTIAVKEFSLVINRGEFVTLLGPSGCGKTTTLRMIAGFAEPTNGGIYLDGKDITRVPARERNMGMVFQAYALFPHLTVFENICFGLRVRKKTRGEIEETVVRLLKLGHMEGLAERYPAQLSGGQQQRVSLLRALAIEPAVLLLDEPLSNLDAKLRVEIRNEIRKMQSLLNITTVYVTHDQEEALAVSDQIAVMEHGSLQQIGIPLEIYLKPKNQFVSDFIGRSNFVSCQVNGQGRIEYEGLCLPLELPDHLQGKDSIILSFRPQYASVHPQGYNPPENFTGACLKGKFTLETFLGTIYQLELATASGDLLIIEMSLEQRGGMKLRQGDSLVLTIPAEHVHIFSGSA